MPASAPDTMLPERYSGYGPPPAPHLELRDIGKQFGSFVALHRINLAVQAGELVTLLGPSGCGKTTLLRAIAGLDPPSSGRILMAGRDVTELPPAARDIGIVFQSYALFPNLTVAQNVSYGLRGPAWPKVRARERTAELLALVGLADQAAKHPGALSGGQQQRVALARALAREPGLLLLDEPLSAIDPLVRDHLRQEIRSLQQRLGVTTLLVTHDQEEALGISDRVVVMSRGRIAQVGTPAEIYDSPADPFVAGFVGRASRIEAVVDSPPGMLQAGPHRLMAEAARPLLFGTRVLCFLRPEHLRLHKRDAAPAGSLPAMVTGVEFLGPICRIALEARPLRLLATVTPEVLASLEAQPGATLAASLPAEHLMVFPDEI
ncbi:ABC transporter ATP-binding protein [Neoroseomonas alba]|nr:ATP-binding cassette domain-containing protein [Neoroseomonas alba]